MADQQFTTEELESETWLPVIGQESDYSVSSLSRIKRTSRGPGTYPGRIINSRMTKRYLQTTLGSRRQYVHHIVAAAFIGPRPKGFEINHKDGHRLNNRATNLEYITPENNWAHRMQMGLQAKGERISKTRLTTENVREIRRRYVHGQNGVLLANEFGVHFNTLYQVVRRETWKHID